MIGLVAACGGDPLVGTWEQQDTSAEIKGELVVHDDGTGEYEQELDDPNGLQGGLVFEVEWTDEGDGTYELELDCDDIKGDFVGLLTCDDITTPDWECELEGDNDELECEYDDSEGGKTKIEFELDV